MKTETKIAIIGAGISGLYLSAKLSEKGYKVFVFETKNKVGEKKSSALYSERILDFVPEAKNFIENEVKEALLYFPRKRIKLNFKKKFFAVNRPKLEEFLYKKSLSLGTTFYFNYPVNDIPSGFDKIIGCDGTFSLIRKKLNLPETKKWMTFLGYLQKNDNSPTVKIWPLKEKGFVWRISRGKVVEYGILGRSYRLREKFENFLKNSNIEIKEIFPGVISFGFALPKNKDITLCGESSGVTKPWSGGGVIWSLKETEMLLENFPDFLRYRREARRFFEKRIFVSEKITNMVYFLGFNFPYLLPKERIIDNDFLL